MWGYPHFLLKIIFLIIALKMVNAQAMKQREFGKTGFKCSEVGFGTWAMGGYWGPRDDRAAIDALIHYLELGGNFIDTAWVYGEGHSESLISSALRESGHSAYIATKIPPKNWQWPGRAASTLDQTFPAEHIEDYLHKSLTNLRADSVDLIQLHVWNDTWLGEKQEDELRQLSDKLKSEGKIRHFGISINDHDPDSALKMVASGLVDSVQVIHNIFDQSPESKLFPLCQKMNVGVIARVPFDEGSLAGALSPEMVFHKKDWRRHYFTPERLIETCQRVEKLKALLGEEAATLPQLALRYNLSHPAVSTVIPGMRRISHVDSNCAVGDGRRLSPVLLEELKKHIWLRNFYPSHG